MKHFFLLVVALAIVTVSLQTAFAQPDAQLKKLLGDLKSKDESIRLDAIFDLGAFGPKAEPAIPHLIEELQSIDDDFQLNAAMMLGKIGKAAVPAVVKLLNDEEADTRYYAVWTLAWIGPQARGTEPLLLKALASDKSSDVRSRAALTLAKIGIPPKVVITALESALHDAHPKVREAAADALSELGRDAVPVLIKTLKLKKTPQSIHAAEALGQIGSNAKDALPELKAWLYSTDGPWRFEAKAALSKIGKPAIPLLGDAVKFENAATGVVAVETLKEIGEEAGPQLLESLKSRHRDVRRTAAAALKVLTNRWYQDADDKVVIAMTSLLNDEDEILRVHAVEVLWRLKTSPYFTKTTVPKLREALLDFNSDIQFHAFLALSRKEAGEHPKQTLLKLLDDQNAATRIKAAACLMRYYKEPKDIKEAVAVLLKGLQEKDSDLQVTAAFALARRGQDNKDMAEIFVGGLQSKITGVREQAIRGLGWYTTAKQAVPQLIDIALHDPEPTLREAALWSSHELSRDPKVMIPVLKKAIHDSDPEVRWLATGVAHNYGNDGVPLLIQCLNDDNPKVRQGAIQMMYRVKSDQASLPHLRPLIGHQNPEVRCAAARLITRCVDAATEELFALMQDEERDVRWQVRFGLDRLQESSIKKLLPRFVEIIMDKKADSKKRGNAVHGLVCLGPSAWPTLRESLNAAKDERLMAVAANEFYYLQLGDNYKENSKAALAILEDALKSKYAMVRRDAIRCLINMKTHAQAAIPFLTQSLSDGDESVREGAAVALKAIQGK